MRAAAEPLLPPLTRACLMLLDDVYCVSSRINLSLRAILGKPTDEVRYYVDVVELMVVVVSYSRDHPAKDLQNIFSANTGFDGVFQYHVKTSKMRISIPRR